MKTPRAVLEAGRRERERWGIAGSRAGFSVRLVRIGQIPLSARTRQECQDFIDDRVFRAMLRELALTHALPDYVAGAVLGFAEDDHD